MKREKIKNDDASVNFRMPRSLKNKIIRQASDRNLTLSKYLREIIEELHERKSAKPKGFSIEIEDYIFSRDFLQFIFWLYSKKDNEKREDGDNIDAYIKLIKQADNMLPNKIVKELDKVLVDLLRIKTASGYDSTYYQFPGSHSVEKKLDYKKLEEFFIGYELGKFLDEKAGYTLL